MYVPMFLKPIDFVYYPRYVYIFNNTLIIAVLAVALYKIKKLLSDAPQVA